MRRILIVLLFTFSGAAPIVLAHPDLASAATHTVAINGAPDCGTSLFCYNPSSLTVTAGDTVTWVNNSTASHTVTSCGPSACARFGSTSGRQGGPSSRRIRANGGTFTFTFTRPGTYDYHSAVHGNATLHGTITVVVAATPPTSPSTTSTTVLSTPTTITGTRPARATQATGSTTYTVKINGTPNCGTSMFCYDPSSLVVHAGDTVTWANNSTAPHTVTRCDAGCPASVGPGNGTQSWPTSPTINANGGTYSFTFTGPGTYNYYCAIHGFAMMHGTITVDSTTTPTTAGTTPTTAGSGPPTTPTTVGVASATSASSSNPPAAFTNQMAGTGAPLSEEGAVGLVLVLLGLGLTAASTARRQRRSEHPCRRAPESSSTVRLLEDFETAGSMQDPDANVARGPSLA
jgi:plastocyanin